MSYCAACGEDDQMSESMHGYPCQRCGAIKNEDGSIEYDGSREGIEESREMSERYDRDEDRY